MKNAKTRALDLEQKILKAIERGTFTPEFGYLDLDVRLGPCGCALGAAAFTSGRKVDENSITLGSMLLREYLVEKGIATEVEGYAIEDGYEGSFMHILPAGVTKADVAASPFYTVGQRLHRFHPNASGV